MTITDSKTRNERLVSVCLVDDPLEAELIRDTLLDHHIRCEIARVHQEGFTSALDIGLLVRESDALRAHGIIEIHHSD